MFKKRNSSLRKNMAILVCVAFLSMAFPEVTQAATKPSSRRCSFLEESFLLISAIFSYAGLNSSPLGCDITLFHSLSNNKPKLPQQAKNGEGNKNGQKKNGSFDSNGNSTSTKTPDDQD